MIFYHITIMYKACFFILLTLAPTTLLASEILNLDKMFSTCLQRDWKSISCNFEEKKDYKPSILSEYVGNNLWKLPRIINAGIEELKKLNGPLQKCSNSSESKMNLLSITSMLQHAVKSRNLTQCKAACMANCVSATLVKYDFSKSGFQTPCKILENQTGGCAEFATFSVYFAKQFGLDADIAYTAFPAHNFTKIRLGDKYYYMEPQSDRCNFFKSK